MLRRSYLLILRLHPRRFRQDFAEEMLLIFDQVAASSAKGTLAETKLLGDGIVSLLRQWGLRPQFRHEPALAATSPPVGDGVPGFYTLESFRPRPMALLHGSILSIAVLCLAFLAIRYAWNHTVNLPFPMVDREVDASADPQSSLASVGRIAVSALSKLSSDPRGFLPSQIETRSRSTAPDDKVSRKMQKTLDMQAHFSAVPTSLARPSTAIAPSPQLLQRYSEIYVAPAGDRVSRKMQAASERRADFAAVPSPPARSSAAVTLSPQLLQRYAGIYVAPPPVLRVRVIAKGGELQIEMAGQPMRTLQPVSETKFQAAGLPDYQFEFQTNPDGTVRQLNIDQGGQRVVAVRQ